MNRPTGGVREIRFADGRPRVRRSSLLALCASCACVVFVLTADSVRLQAAVDEPIVDVQVEGNVSIPTSAIMQHVKTQRNRMATPEQVREDVRQLYSTRWFFSVEPRYRKTEAGMVLVFKVLERPMVKRVEYRGNKKIKTNRLAALTGIKTGSPFDVAANRESVRRIENLYREKGYNFVTVELASGGNASDRDVVFQVKEGPKVRVVKRTINGGKFIGAARLKTKLRTKAAILGIFGGKYDPSSINDDIEALRQYYHGLGFFDAKIEAEPRFSQDRSKVYVEYTVAEGTRYKVRNVSVEGNRVLTQQSLQKDFKLHGGDFFDARSLNKDVSGMKDKYGRLGRLFAKVEAVPRFVEEPRGVVDLVYRIDEDRVQRIRRVNIHFEGEHPHTKETVVRDRSLIHPGDLADAKLIQRTKSRLEGTQLFEGGAQGVRIDISRSSGAGGPASNSIVRGQQQKPSSDVISANAMTPPTPGVGHTLAEAQTRLTRVTAAKYGHSKAGTAIQDTAYQRPSDRTINVAPVYETTPSNTVFRGQTPDFQPGLVRGQSFDGPFRMPNDPIYDNSPQGDPLGRSIRTPPEWVDLDIYATEARTGRLMFGVGVNSDAGVVGSIVIDESNFDILNPPGSFSDFVNGTAWRGGGQRFRLEAAPGDVVSRYLMSWTDPYFLHTDYSLSVSGFYFNRFYPAWDEDRLGGRVAVGRQWTPEWSTTMAVRMEEVKISNPDVPTPPSLTAALGESFLSTLRFSVAHDTRNMAISPSEGHFAQANYEQAVGDYTYPRLEGEYRQYFTLHSRPDGSGRHVLTLGGQLGWSGSDTPIFERFYAGGFQTFRGFAFRGVSPRVLGVAVGGDWMALGTAEYRIPLTADDMIQAVVFSDFGTVEADAGFEQYRVSVGAGIRLQVPAMGPVPLAFDFGFPIVKEDFDDRRVFSFYVGINR